MLELVPKVLRSLIHRQRRKMADWYKASLAPPSEQVREEARRLYGGDDEEEQLPFTSRRSPVLCRHACVASSQPLASSVGLRLLLDGANAADTAVAVAAALAVTEPCSTGLGGDMFCLYYDAATRQVHAINGSGRSSSTLTLDVLRQAYPDGQGGVDRAAFRDSPLAVTVPGAAQGWEDLWKRHGSGRFTLSQLLEPAAVLAEEGFPVTPITSYHWRGGMSQIQKWLSDDGLASGNIPLTVDGQRPPQAGDIVQNPDMARVLRTLGEQGAQEGFYRGAPGQAIVQVLQRHVPAGGGDTLTVEDLQQHTTSTFPEPICATYRDHKLWQVPPNGQGIAGLIALSGLEWLEQQNAVERITPQTLGSAPAYHVLMEMMRLGFADARRYVSDPDTMKVTNEWLLDPDRIGKRAQTLFDANKAVVQGTPEESSCTVSFQVVDAQGNAVSFVNSNYMGFGTGIVPEGCGFTLQNRGFGFTTDSPDHPNVVAPRKRPYHTIIPALLTHADTDELYATLTNMGGNMQPQGHLQLTVDMLAGGLDPQAAIDRPRFCILDGTQDGVVSLEEGVSQDVLDELTLMGHKMNPNIRGHQRSIFGRAQIIKRDRKTGVLWAGSDGRADGCAMGF